MELCRLVDRRMELASHLMRISEDSLSTIENIRNDTATLDATLLHQGVIDPETRD
jgi:hypothetical protein